MAWTTLDTNNLLAGEPLVEQETLAFYENVIAQANGDAGAPRQQDASLSTNATNTGRDWVLARNALAGAGAVGTYAMLRTNEISEGTSSLSAGSTRAGSTLGYANAGGGVSGSPSGTWRLMGFLSGIPSGTSDNPQGRTSIWLRIS